MPLVGLFSGLNISAMGLRAQRIRQDIVSSNLANVETTRTSEGGPYRRQSVILEADSDELNFRQVFGPDKMGGHTTHTRHIFIPKDEMPIVDEKVGNGVEVVQIVQDQRPPRMIYNPDHPDADGEGYVAMPNINVIAEMVDMISATRAYEANVTALNATKGMLMRAIEI